MSEKEYECCGRKFKTLQALASHMVNEHQSRGCGSCGGCGSSCS